MLFFAEKCPKNGERFGKGKKGESSRKEGSPFPSPYADGEGVTKKTLAFPAGVCYNGSDKTRQAFFEGDLLCLLSVT